MFVQCGFRKDWKNVSIDEINLWSAIAGVIFFVALVWLTLKRSRPERNSHKQVVDSFLEAVKFFLKHPNDLITISEPKGSPFRVGLMSSNDPELIILRAKIQSQYLREVMRRLHEVLPSGAEFERHSVTTDVYLFFIRVSR